jgi:hypothetical protein
MSPAASKKAAKKIRKSGSVFHPDGFLHETHLCFFLIPLFFM